MPDTSGIPEGPVIGCVHIQAMLETFVGSCVSFQSCGCCGGVSFYCTDCDAGVEECAALEYIAKREGGEG